MYELFLAKSRFNPDNRRFAKCPIKTPACGSGFVLRFLIGLVYRIKGANIRSNIVAAAEEGYADFAEEDDEPYKRTRRYNARRL
ncbi:MAG TPA: hypothetical protein DEA22_09230, partial [Blastocatellia bacterium]|nr:hypothetical protein [Blastocatellia bacterium]